MTAFGFRPQRAGDVLSQVLSLEPLRRELDVGLLTGYQPASAKPRDPDDEALGPVVQLDHPGHAPAVDGSPDGMPTLGALSASGSNGTGIGTRPPQPSATVTSNSFTLIR